ncbi:hypothetical protein BGX34_004120, partial [Mortierella sp. NVP85]
MQRTEHEPGATFVSDPEHFLEPVPLCIHSKYHFYLFENHGLQIQHNSHLQANGYNPPPHDSVFPAQIFPENVRPFTTEIRLPEKNEKLDSTQQLIGCLSLLRAPRHLREALDSEARKWLDATEKDSDEQDRLKTLAAEAIRTFKRDELKGTRTVTEAANLASVLSKDAFKDLLREFYSKIDRSEMLDVHQLEGIAQLIQGGPGYLDADDSVKILGLLSKHLQDTHQQPSHQMYQLTLAVSHVLDAMADTNVTDLDRKRLHDPLS